MEQGLTIPANFSFLDALKNKVESELDCLVTRIKGHLDVGYQEFASTEVEFDVECEKPWVQDVVGVKQLRTTVRVILYGDRWMISDIRQDVVWMGYRPS